MVLLFLVAALFASEGVPNHYQGLSFGASDSILKTQHPESDSYRFTLARIEGSFPKGVSAYRLLHKKGAIDSVRFYFVDNHFTMAVEYYYPGKEFRDRAFNSANARFGQFVGTRQYAWRKRDRYLVMLTCNPKTEIATLSYLCTDFADRLRPPSETEAIDAELKMLQSQLDSLSTSKLK